MIDHTKTAEQLADDARILHYIRANTSRTAHDKTIIQNIIDHHLGLADWHLTEATKPATKNEAETLLACGAEALREHLNAAIESGNDEASYRDLAALINDIDNYFIDSISRADDNHGWTLATSPPDAYQAVTVYTETGTVHQASYDDDSGYWHDTIYGHVIHNVSHWIDLIYPGEDLTPTNLQKAAEKALTPTQ